MSSGNAIIAKMGLDLSGLQRDLTTAEKRFIQASNNMQSASKRGVAHAGGGGAQTRPIGDAINALTGSSGNVNKMNMLTHSLGLTTGEAAGALAAFTALGGALTFLKSKQDETLKSNNDLSKALGRRPSRGAWEALPIPDYLKPDRQLGDRAAYGESALKKKRQQLAELSAEAEKTRGFWHTMASTIASPFGGGAVEKSLRLQKEADEERLRIDAQLAGVVRSEISAREELAHGSERNGRLALHHLETAKKIAALHDDKEMGTQEHAAQVAAVTAAAEIEEQSINRQADLKENALRAEENLTAIHASGNYEAERSAQVQRDAAQNALEILHEATAEERAAAAAKVHAAQVAYDFAKRDQTVIEQQQKSATELAELQTNADNAHLAALISAERLLSAQRKTAKADEQRAIDVQLAQNRAAQRDEGFKRAQSGFGLAETLIGAGTGRGGAEQMRATLEKLALARAHAASIASNPLASDEDRAGAAAKINDLTKSYQDQAEARGLSLAQAKGETDAMAAQLAHQDAIAQTVRTQHEYAVKIFEAHKNGDHALAAQLQKQAQLSAQQQARDLAQRRRERNQLTLGELATTGSASQRAKASRIENLERRARRLAGTGRAEDLDKSQSIRERADAIKRGMGSLKDSEKDLGGELTGALDASKVLGEIATNTKGARNAR